MPANPAPRRRWFQVKLSTWFVLVGILVWALWLRPWVLTTVAELDAAGVTVIGGFSHTEEMPSAYWSDGISPMINPRLLYPALALIAFVGWKAASAIGRRVRARKGEQA